MVSCPIAVCYGSRSTTFIEPPSIGCKSNSKTPYWRGGGLCHQCHHCPRVEATTKKCSNLHISNHVTLNGIFEVISELLDPLLLRLAVIWSRLNVPETGEIRLTIPVGQGMPGRKLLDSFEDGEIARNAQVHEVLSHCVGIDISTYARMDEEGFQFRTKYQAFGHFRVIQWLNSQTVSSE